MRLQYRQRLAARPESVWPFITQPELMNRWSTARITLLEEGEFGAPGGIGAVRRIEIPSLVTPVSFREVIVDATPPQYLVYRVTDGLPIRDHCGMMSLLPDDEGTELRWTVDAVFPLQLLAWGAQYVLDGELRRSLARLADVVVAEPGQSSWHQQSGMPGELPPAAELWDTAECALQEQRMLADHLEQQSDPKFWFTRVYAYVTEEQLKACRTGRIQHAGWVLRLIEYFHRYYVDNLRRWMGTLPGPVEAHWRSAFRAMDEGHRWHRNRVRAIAHGLAKGVQAHIEEDLPRALAQVYVHHYADQCDYVRFRADYLLMADVFRAASMRLMEQLRAYFPIYLRLTEPLFPQELRDLCIRTVFYDFHRQRTKTFERGGRLAQLMLATMAAATNRLPNLSPQLELSTEKLLH